MVRRWSCVINIKNNFSFKNNFFFKNYKIEIFKNAVNFKRFSFKFTKFKRKSLIRIKHKTNFLIYTNLIKYWVKDYMFNKNYVKYQYLNKIFLNNFYFYNFNFTKNRNESFFYNFNFIFSTFLNNKFFYFNKYLFSNFKNSSLTTAWYVSNPHINFSVLPVLSSWESTLTPFNELKNKNFNFNTLFDIIFSMNLKKIIEIRKILIIMFYNNIFLKS